MDSNAKVLSMPSDTVHGPDKENLARSHLKILCSQIFQADEAHGLRATGAALHGAATSWDAGAAPAKQAQQVGGRAC